MRRHTCGSGLAASVGPLLAAGILLTGCASGGETEWEVAANPRATADDIITAGHAADIATAGDQMVVTWEVEPEDDEGPYQGAWRLYDRETGEVEDGTFGTVREASAHIDVVPVRDGFLLTDYVKHAQHILDVEGRLLPAQLDEAELGTPLAGGVLLEKPDDAGWNVLLPNMTVVQLTDLPTRDVQGIQLTSDGTVWVLLPWTTDGTYRVAYAKDGRGPWTTETIPLPKGLGTGGEGISAAGKTLFVVAGREKEDRTTVDVVLSRAAGAKGTWERIDASGIADDLTSTPHIAVPAKRRLVALAAEGAWVQEPDRAGFAALRLPPARGRSVLGVSTGGSWLWASEHNGGNALHYSHDFGKTWREFER